MCAVIGPNGAGKTTFFNLIAVFPRRPRAPSFSTARTSPSFPPWRVSRGMARTFQITEMFPELTVFENLQIAAEVAGGFRLRTWLNREETLVPRPHRGHPRDGGLDAKADRLVGELSHGDQRATEIMMALALKPRLCCSTSRPPAWATRRPMTSPS